jgi:hypothetical protein
MVRACYSFRCHSARVPGIKYEAKCYKSKELKMKVLKDTISYSGSHRSVQELSMRCYSSTDNRETGD